MSHTKISPKILEVIIKIPNEQEFSKINQALIEQKLITKIEYEIAESKERITKQGAVWHLVTLSCKLTIIDVESDETMVNIAFGSGVDQGDKAVAKAATMAWRYVWLSALNIAVNEMAEVPDVVVPDVVVPDFIVETSETKLISTINALWKWTPAELTTWVTTRFNGRFLDQLNVSELSVLKSELLNYGGKD